METESTLVYKLEGAQRREILLQQTADDLKTKLQSRFGGVYTVSSGNFTAPEKDWSHEITIRQGNKIGVSVYLKWEKTSPDVVKMDVYESSKLGNIITYAIGGSFLAVGAYLAYNDMEPLAFLPGKKIAAGLGGLIALVPAALIIYGLKKMLLNGEKEQNNRLVSEVKQALGA